MVLRRSVQWFKPLLPVWAKRRIKEFLRSAVNPDAPPPAASQRPVEFFPPGHFHSPVVDPETINEDKHSSGTFHAREIPGIDLNEGGQVTLFEELSGYYDELPFADEKSGDLRYHYVNGMYSYGDAIILYSMLRHFQPRRVVEVGSGFSSALMLDVNERFLGNEIQLTFIEPYPERLNSLLRPGDRAELIEQGLQGVGDGVFEELQSGDFLFVDSSHVAKHCSDVNKLFFDILPRLKTGVFIHFHDIFYPFEYPLAWLKRGISWNEGYILRSFLMYNPNYRIRFFNHYFMGFHAERMKDKMPLMMKNPGGSFWLEKIQE